MKSKPRKTDLLHIPVHEHLDVYRKSSYFQRLKWLEEAFSFVNKLRGCKKSFSR